MNFIVREFYFALRITLLSRNGAVLYFCLLVLVPWFGHQGIAFGAAFDYPRFDSAGSVTDFVAGNLKKVVSAQRFPDRFLRRHQPLRQKRIACNSKTHLAGKFIVNKGCLSTD